MNPSKGAVKKIPGPTLYTLVDDNSDETISLSYKIKIKHVCQNCQYHIEDSIVRGLMKPLHHATSCKMCTRWCVRQPYGNLCSLCSLTLCLCARCLQVYDEFAGSEHPLDTILNSKMQRIIALLPIDKRRAPLHSMFAMWKTYQKGKININEVREKLYKELKFWNILYGKK